MRFQGNAFKPFSCQGTQIFIQLTGVNRQDGSSLQATSLGALATVTTAGIYFMLIGKLSPMK